MKNFTTQIVKSTQYAFTLMEMILVIAIIAVLIAVGAGTLGDFGVQAEITAARGQIKTLESAVRMYKVNNRTLPPSLEALVKPPANALVKRPFVENESAITDPWGTKYQFRSPGKDGRSFDIYSMGPDQREGTDDDVFSH